MDMKTTYIIVAIIIVLCIISVLVGKSSKGGKLNYKNYLRKQLLTANELNFYKALYPIAKKMNLQILTKVRVADFIQVKAGTNDYMTYFNKISQKHVDFMLADYLNLNIILLIELDDKTHDTAKGKGRDNFVNEIYEATGMKILHIRSAINLEFEIQKAISPLPVRP